MKAKVLRGFVILIVLVANIGCDQISKKIVRDRISDDERISIISNYFTLMKVENSGAFLSLGDSLPQTFKFIILSLLPLFILGIGLGYLILKTALSKRMMLGFAFVIGGGIGNIYDRLLYGSVTDFLHIDLGVVQTGVFNLADVSIMMGVFIVLMDSFLKRNLSSDNA